MRIILQWVVWGMVVASCSQQKSENTTDMDQYSAEQVDKIEAVVGQPFLLESLRQAVVPPYLMLLPFLDPSANIVVNEQRSLDEDGVHGCTFVLEVTEPGDSYLTVGFRDLQTGDTTHTKRIRVVTP